MKNASVLFVCLGNICRSPTAHGVFNALLEREGLTHVVSVESAGISGWHIGEPPDSRTSAAAKTRGYDLTVLRGRQVNREDFELYDYILAMDKSNLSDLRDLCPQGFAGHLGLFLEFGSQQDYLEVPDPYYGGAKGFELVLDLVEDACSGLLSHLQSQKEEA